MEFEHPKNLNYLQPMNFNQIVKYDTHKNDLVVSQYLNVG